MHVTDLIDISTLRELNACLADALGIDMVLTDADGIPIAGSDEHGQLQYGDCPETGASDECAVPVFIRGKRSATWHLKGLSRDANAAVQAHFTQDDHQWHRDRAETATPLMVQTQEIAENSVMLVSLLARLITDYASANLNMLERVHEHARAALDATRSLVAMQRTVDNSPVGLVEVDRDGLIRWSNQTACQMLDLGRSETPVTAGQTAPWRLESIDGVPRSTAWVAVARQLARGETVSGLVCELSRPDGRRLRLRVDASPRLSEFGRVIRIMYAVQQAGADVSAPVRGDSACLMAPLLQAWLELDAVRRSLRPGDAAVSGSLDIVAALLKEAVSCMPA